MKVRLNLDNPKHIKIHKALENINHDVYKSKNQMIIEALEFYINNFGNEKHLENEEKNSSKFVKKEVFDRNIDEVKEQIGCIRKDIRDVVKDEIIKALGNVASNGNNKAENISKAVDEINREVNLMDYQEDDTDNEDDVVVSLAKGWM